MQKRDQTLKMVGTVPAINQTLTGVHEDNSCSVAG